MGSSCRNIGVFLLSFYLFPYFLCLFSHAADTITGNHTIRDGQTLISAGKNFVLGFFSPNNSKNHYVGIWYYKISIQTVVWIANRENPVTDSSGVLTIGNGGNLIILDGKQNTLWSTKASFISNTSIAQLLDSGNLILRTSGDYERVLWQSFDHPTDSLLPSMKVGLDLRTGQKWFYTSWKSPVDPSPGNYTLGVDPHGVAQLVIWENLTKHWRSGYWNGQTFTGVANMLPLYLYGFRLANDNQDGRMFFTYSMLNSSLILRIVTKWDGREEPQRCEEGKQQWITPWSEPITRCQIYGKCGNFGSCNELDSPICSCLRGFKPKAVEEWSKGNWSSGCVRRNQLECEINSSSEGNRDGFLKLDRLKLPDLADWLAVQDEKECEGKCSMNCSCRAHAYVNGIGCLIWGRDLVDIHRFPEGGNTLYIRLAGSELGDQRKISKIIMIVIVLFGTVFLSIGAYFLRRCMRKLKGSWKKEKENELLTFDLSNSGEGSSIKELGGGQQAKSELQLFSFSSVAAATNNFSDANRLGEGGFGPVYKGILPGGQEIAVKRLSRSSGQGLEEFKNEVILIAKLQHRNLVRLLGCCIQGEEKILLYEHMPNRSLDAFLFDPTKQALLDWTKRFNIIEGIARGLLYLHRDSRLRIIHRDLKASNILLDEDMNPKISDFGMARIFGGDQNQENTKRVVGTYGYMSPEYAMEGLFSVKSDVYSFGVLLIEIVSCKKNNSFHDTEHSLSLLGYAWKLWDEGKAMELMDPSLGDSCSTCEVLRCIHVGLLCVQDCALDRPTMDSVVLMLQSENATNPTPKQPSFSSGRTPRETVSLHGTESFCTNDVTVTTVVGR
ncbi:G-type lectin S-receptor-like serine/threonine-protein kinase B120 [Tasmannia lanceolata]|uniref:G-type lectin S-receptor-like serine/threonine-protein kinase B120 n=1 Tax=Tasmannia lanceolata TaxID=3420 RepID=UPI0040632867